VVGQHLGMGQRHLPLDQGLAGLGEGAAVQGAGGADQAVGSPGAHPEPVAQPGGGGGGRDAVFGAGGAAGVHGGQPGQPVAVQAVGQPLQPCRPFGQGGVGQAVWGRGGQLGDLGLQGRQPIPPGDRMGVRVHGRNLPGPHRKASTNPRIVENPSVTDCTSPAATAAPLAPNWTPRSTSARSFLATLMPGECMGPERATI
jgi:hypothetical protein